MKKEIFLISALAAVLVTGCTVAGKNSDDNQQTIGTVIEENADVQIDDEQAAENDEQNGTIEAEGTENADGTENANGTDTNADDANAATEGSENTDASVIGSSAEFTAFGHYADMQGTEDIYSDILINKQDDGSIYVEIGIYRLTSLSGYATTTEDPMVLNFVNDDGDRKINGTIVCSENGAVFTVTESDWSLLNVGDTVDCTTILAE